MTQRPTQTPLTIFAQTAPGWTALTVGVNDGLPPGARAFSVGEGDAELVLGDGVVVVDGASFSLVVLHAVRLPITTRATPPAAIAIRRLKRSVLTMCPVFSGFAYRRSRHGRNSRPIVVHAARPQGAVKPSRLCEPSQNGLFSECPHRHR